MPPRYSRYRTSPGRPFTHDTPPRRRGFVPTKWKIVGVIIFIGLVLSLFDELSKSAAKRREPSAPAATTARYDQGSTPSKVSDPGVRRRQP